MQLSRLPAPEVLRRRHEALAAVETMVKESSNVDDGFRHYAAEPPDHYWFDSGGGDSLELVINGSDEALLTAFDHESPRSPWGRDDQLPEWPGMFDGLPDRLREQLPEREEDEPLSVSACFWFVDGRWQEGRPEPVPREGDLYDDDPGGAAALLAPLLDSEAEVRDLVYDQPERLDDALALFRRLAHG